MADSSTRLGPYDLLGKLGAGGMGEVHLARDTRLEREVAIKILPDAHTTDRDRRARLLREARAAAALNHPNIATIYDVGEAEGRDYVAFERIEGRSLAEVLATRQLGADEILDLALSLADALAYAHERGVIHRDVKSANVMLTDTGVPKLLDFGLAKVERDGDTQAATELTLPGAVMGTPGAMSPEQAQGRPVDARSDVFSFGSLLYELAARRPAFTGETVMDVVAAVLRDEPEPLSRLRPDLPEGFVRVVERAQRKDPAERYPSMRELIADLKRVAAADRRSPATRRAHPLVLAAVALLVLGGTAWLLLRRGEGGGAPRASGERSFAGARIGVIGFENVADPEDADHLVRMLVPLVTTDLAESGGLDVLSSARVRESVRRVLGPDAEYDASFAREIARAADAEVMLVGDVTQDRGRLRVVSELVEVESGRSLGAVRADAASRDELFQLAADLCSAVRDQLGLGRAAEGAEAFDAAASLTSSTRAWNRFVAGRLALHLGEYTDAASHFEAAIREDETFALAYFYLAVAHDWAGLLEDNLNALIAGLPYIERLPERWRRVYQAALHWSRDDWDTAYEELAEIIQEDDVLPDALNLMGEVIEHDANHWDPVLARSVFERALEIDPTFEVVLFHLVDTLLLMGDDEAIARLVADLRARDPNSPRALSTEVMADIWHGRWKEAEPLAEEAWRRRLFAAWWIRTTVMRATGRHDEAWPLLDDAVEHEQGLLQRWALNSRGLALMERGRFEEALRDLGAVRAMFDDAEHTRLLRAAGIFGEHNALLLAKTGAAEEAVAVMRDAVELVPGEPSCYYWLVYLSWENGAADEVPAVIDAFAAVRAGTHNTTFPFWADMLEAEGAFRAGDFPRARAALARANARPRELRDRPVESWLRARLDEAEGDVRGAVDAYAGVVRTYRWYTEMHTLIAIEARVRRAFLLQDLGDPRFDRSVLEELVEAWGETGLPEVVEARARLAR